MSRLFSASERDKVKQLVVGKPTGVLVEIGGVILDLVPLTTQQGKDVTSLFDAFRELKDKAVTLTVADLAQILLSKRDIVFSLLRGILWRTVVANEQVDQDDGGQEAFDEWFDNLEFQPMLKALLPAILEANGLKSLLGNGRPAATEAEAPPVETPST